MCCSFFNDLDLLTDCFLFDTEMAYTFSNARSKFRADMNKSNVNEAYSC
jgi:hypothetical protein